MRRNIDANRLSAYWRAVSIRSIARRTMFRVATRMAAQAQLYAFAEESMARFPLLDRWLRAIIRTEERNAQARAERNRVVDVADLTPRGHRVYLDLMRALDHGQ